MVRITFFLCCSLFLSYRCVANSLHSSKEKLKKVHDTMSRYELFAWPKNRPEKCSINSVAFSDIASQVSSIASSMAHGKCYEKHSKLIGDLSYLTRGLPQEKVKNVPEIENGALIDPEKK